MISSSSWVLPPAHFKNGPATGTAETDALATIETEPTQRFDARRKSRILDELMISVLAGYAGWADFAAASSRASSLSEYVGNWLPSHASRPFSTDTAVTPFS